MSRHATYEDIRARARVTNGRTISRTAAAQWGQLGPWRGSSSPAIDSAECCASSPASMSSADIDALAGNPRCAAGWNSTPWRWSWRRTGPRTRAWWTAARRPATPGWRVARRWPRSLESVTNGPRPRSPRPIDALRVDVIPRFADGRRCPRRIQVRVRPPPRSSKSISATCLPTASGEWSRGPPAWRPGVERVALWSRVRLATERE